MATTKMGKKTQPGPGTIRHGAAQNIFGTLIAVNDDYTADIAENGSSRVWFGVPIGGMADNEGAGVHFLPTVGANITMKTGGAGGAQAILDGGLGAPGGGAGAQGKRPNLQPGDIAIKSSAGGGMQANSDGSMQSGSGGLGMKHVDRKGKESTFSRTMNFASLGGAITSGEDGGGIGIFGNMGAGTPTGGSSMNVGGPDGISGDAGGASSFKFGMDGLSEIEASVEQKISAPQIILEGADIMLKGNIILVGDVSIGSASPGGDLTIENNLQCKNISCKDVEANSIITAPGSTGNAAANEDMKFLVDFINSQLNFAIQSHVHTAPNTPTIYKVTEIQGPPIGLINVKG